MARQGITVRDETHARNEERVRSVFPIIFSRIRDAGPLSGDDLARAARTSPFYFRRVFSDVVGEPVHQFIRRLRMVRAAYHLTFTELSVGDVAAQAGYLSHAAFARAFRDVFGTCPRSLRSSRAEWSELPAARAARIPAQRVAFLPVVGRPEHGRPRRSLLTSWAQRRHGGSGGNPPGLFDVVYDDPERFLGRGSRYDAGVVLSDSVATCPALRLRTTPATDVLAIEHSGPLELLPFSCMLLAVTAVARGLLPSPDPPLPYFLRWPIPEPSQPGWPQPDSSPWEQAGTDGTTVEVAVPLTRSAHRKMIIGYDPRHA
jgi:AraC family transcriptional regulator